MIRPRNLAIPPILSIGAVSAILVAAAFSFRSADIPEPAPVGVGTFAPDVKFVAPPETSDVLTVEAFPEFYDGHFLWDGQQYEDHQVVGLDVHDVRAVDGLIRATGRGTYADNFGSSDFTFRIEANPKTGEWTMWESEPEIAANFVTEGRHEATFIDNVENVSARWVGDNGQHGRLVLHAMHESTRVSNAKTSFFEPAPTSAQHLNNGVRLHKRFEGNPADCVTSGTDRVTVHYSGWNTEGVFDDSWKRGRPATFKPTQVIPGWTTALHNMCAGDFARVWIPADQAYGESYRGAVPTGDLIFDIEIIRIDR